MPDLIGEFTFPENGGISVLDFPGQGAMSKVFGREGGSYSELQDYLHLESEAYSNAYDLMTFYDNHDMKRIDADEAGFIDANNWLFTSRGIPVVYYGSESGFRAGTDQHSGNRDYFGQENIELAKSHPIRAVLTTVARLRKNSVALQRGLQANLALGEDTATFYRVHQKDGVNQTALVLLNKGDNAATLEVSKWLSHGTWRGALTGAKYEVTESSARLDIDVKAHGIRVLLFDRPVNDAGLITELDRLQRRKTREQ